MDAISDSARHVDQVTKGLVAAGIGGAAGMYVPPPYAVLACAFTIFTLVKTRAVMTYSAWLLVSVGAAAPSYQVAQGTFSDAGMAVGIAAFAGMLAYASRERDWNTHDSHALLLALATKSGVSAAALLPSPFHWIAAPSAAADFCCGALAMFLAILLSPLALLVPDSLVHVVGSCALTLIQGGLIWGQVLVLSSIVRVVTR